MIIYIIGGLLIALALILAFEWASVYHPKRDILNTPKTAGLDFEDIFFATDDDRHLHGWWVPNGDASSVVIFCHGNSGNIGDRVGIIQSLHDLGFTVFAFDYRGFGKSRGFPSEKGTARDVKAAAEVVRVKNTASLPVIIYGRSLGGAVAAQLAAMQKVDGLILESTFTSIPEMGRYFYPFLPKGFSRIQYNTLKKVKTLTCPVLVAHGQQDGLIPFWMGEALRDHVVGGAEWVELLGAHNDQPFDTSPNYGHFFKTFVSKCSS